MLKLTLLPDEYVTIGDIVVQLVRVAGGRADIAIDAPRTVPIVRGAVLERNGGQRPACLAHRQRSEPGPTGTKCSAGMTIANEPCAL